MSTLEHSSLGPIDAETERSFDELIELPASERELALARLRATSPELAARVARLLAASLAAPDFLERPAAETDLVGHDAGPWRLEARMAAGGAGDVYRAHRRDGSVDWHVAIKVLTGTVDDEASRQRFEAERQTLAALNHPYIAPLVDAGVLPDGRPYLATKLIEGETLDRHTAPLALEARLRLFLAICAAVQHAHERFVAHCDLKPSNILVTREGIPQLVDFGIARWVADPLRRGERSWTPGYASPEQLRGEALSTATDVYSLGVILFELVHDRLPSERPEQRGDRKRVAPDLIAIGNRALAEQPAQRFASVERLASDVARFLAGRPVTARSASRARRAWMFVLRNRVATAACGIAIASLGLAVSSLVRDLRSTREEASTGWRAHSEAARAVRFLEDLARRSASAPGFGEALDAAEKQIAAEAGIGPEAEGRLRIALGALYLDAGRAKDAVTQLERAREIAHSTPGFGPVDRERIDALLARCQVEISKATLPSPPR